MSDLHFFPNFKLTRLLYIDTGANSSFSWRRHQMETFSASLAICAGNSPFTAEVHTQRPVMRSFDVFFDLSLYELRSEKISKLRVSGLSQGNSPLTGEFPSQRASNAENVLHVPVLKSWKISHPWHLWKLAQSCKRLQLLCPPDPWNLPGTALLLKSTE